MVVSAVLSASSAIRTPMLSTRFLPRAHQKRLFTVLALESSADDTCAAVVTSAGKILSNIVVKQNHM
jgi:hypothetical protein